MPSEQTIKSSSLSSQSKAEYATDDSSTNSLSGEIVEASPKIACERSLSLTPHLEAIIAPRLVVSEPPGAMVPSSSTIVGEAAVGVGPDAVGATVPSSSTIIGEAAVGVGPDAVGTKAGVDGVPLIAPKGEDVAGPPLESSRGVGSTVPCNEGVPTIPLDDGDEGWPFDVGSPFDEGVVEGAPIIFLDEGAGGCPDEVGLPFDDGDSTPPLDDGTSLVGVDGATPFDVEGAELLLELIIPFGYLPLSDGAVTGEMFCGGGGTLDGISTPGAGATTTGVEGTEGVVGIRSGDGTVGGEIMVGATTGDGTVGGVMMMGVGANGCIGILNDMLLSSCNNRSNISISNDKFSSLYFLAFTCIVDKGWRLRYLLNNDGSF